MAAHSSVLAWRIPGTGEPGGLPSTESNRVGHDWGDLAAAAAAAGQKVRKMLDKLGCLKYSGNYFNFILNLKRPQRFCTAEDTIKNEKATYGMGKNIFRTCIL